MGVKNGRRLANKNVDRYGKADSRMKSTKQRFQKLSLLF